MHPRGLFAVAIGLATISSGIYLFFASVLPGLVLVFIGVSAVSYVFGINGPVTGRGVRGFRSRLWAQREELRETIESEKREKGEED